MRTSSRCPDFVVVQGRTHEYQRAKTILNRGKHPTFIGRQTFATCARNGGVTFFTVAGLDVAVSLANARTNCLLVLCVIPSQRRAGLGRAIVEYLQCSFARVIESAVPFFVDCGYLSIGEPKMGKLWKTQIMVRRSLTELAGRVSTLLADR